MFHSALLRKSLRDHMRGIIGWAIGVAGIIAIQMSVYPTVRSSAADWSTLTDTFPEVFRKILRMSDYTSETGYLSTELLSFVIPFIFIGLGSSWGARLTSEEEELGTADILMSLPVTRRSIVFTRFCASSLVLIVISALMAISLAIGGRLLDLSIALRFYVATAFVLFLLGWMSMAVAAAVGTFTGKRGVALGASLSMALFTFVLYSLAPLVGFLNDINPANPFQWTIGSTPLSSGVSVGYSCLAVLVTAIGVTLTFVLFERRDLPS